MMSDTRLSAEYDRAALVPLPRVAVSRRLRLSYVYVATVDGAGAVESSLGSYCINSEKTKSKT